MTDVVSIDEAWARFPLAMERANLGIGDMMTRPGFRLRLWKDDTTLLAQCEVTAEERANHVRRAMLRRNLWPLLIRGVTHEMERSEKRARSLCGIKVDKRKQYWHESQDRLIDCLACMATDSPLRSRLGRHDVNDWSWTRSVAWMPFPGIWNRCGWSVASHPRNPPGLYEGESSLPVT